MTVSGIDGLLSNLSNQAMSLERIIRTICEHVDIIDRRVTALAASIVDINTKVQSLEHSVEGFASDDNTLVQQLSSFQEHPGQSSNPARKSLLVSNFLGTISKQHAEAEAIRSNSVTSFSVFTESTMLLKKKSKSVALTPDKYTMSKLFTRQQLDQEKHNSQSKAAASTHKASQVLLDSEASCPAEVMDTDAAKPQGKVEAARIQPNDKEVLNNTELQPETPRKEIKDQSRSTKTNLPTNSQQQQATTAASNTLVPSIEEGIPCINENKFAPVQPKNEERKPDKTPALQPAFEEITTRPNNKNTSKVFIAATSKSDEKADSQQSKNAGGQATSEGIRAKAMSNLTKMLMNRTPVEKKERKTVSTRIQDLEALCKAQEERIRKIENSREADNTQENEQMDQIYLHLAKLESKMINAVNDNQCNIAKLKETKTDKSELNLAASRLKDEIFAMECALKDFEKSPVVQLLHSKLEKGMGELAESISAFKESMKLNKEAMAEQSRVNLSLKKQMRQKVDLKRYEALEEFVHAKVQEDEEDCSIRCLSCNREVIEPDEKAAASSEKVSGASQLNSPSKISTHMLRSTLPLNVRIARAPLPKDAVDPRESIKFNVVASATAGQLRTLHK